jgi:peptidoglycan glycosyltransferase
VLTRAAALALCIALGIAASSCTSRSERVLPSAARAADGLIAALNARDARRLREFFDRRSRRRWTTARLRRYLAAAVEQGAIESFDVSRGPAVENPGSPRVDFPYRITYSSRALRKPAALDGRLRLTYDRRRGEWETAWSRASLWPGVPGATHFEALTRWPRRARLVDRAGRTVAGGSAEHRRYPFGSTGGSVVGHVGVLERRSGARSWHRRGDLVGASGLEGAYDDRLSGAPSTRLVVEGRGDRRLATLGHRPARPGKRVTTTLDMSVQQAAERAFGSTVGGAVVLDPSTGNVLAAVATPAFDPSDYVGARDVAPFNRALSGLYPPGSSMKAVTASAALDAGVVTPRSRVTGPMEYKGVRNFESGRFGRIDFATATRYSVNTAYAQVAEKLGTRRLVQYARAFGFGRAPAMKLGAATPSFPVPHDLFDLMWSSIGQAQVLATPLEMASVAATIADRGVRMEPRSTFLDPKERTRVTTRRTAAVVGRLMQEVVRGGTGVRAQIPGVAVAGKTGTAEVDVDGMRRNHAWFIAFAPAGAPKVAVAVVAEYGGVGGEVAAPLAGRILAAVLPLVR